MRQNDISTAEGSQSLGRITTVERGKLAIAPLAMIAQLFKYPKLSRSLERIAEVSKTMCRRFDLSAIRPQIRNAKFSENKIRLPRVLSARNDAGGVGFDETLCESCGVAGQRSDNDCGDDSDIADDLPDEAEDSNVPF